MSLGRRAGYNWKARQKRESKKKSVETFSVELDESLFSSGCVTCECPLDSNVPVLPSKKVKLAEDYDSHGLKRKKLSAKQRKRLLKVVEVKEKKAKVCNSN